MCRSAARQPAVTLQCGVLLAEDGSVCIVLPFGKVKGDARLRAIARPVCPVLGVEGLQPACAKPGAGGGGLGGQGMPEDEQAFADL